MKKLIGLDIGGTKCAIILGEEDNGNLKIIDKLVFATETQKGPQYALDKFYSGIPEILKKTLSENY